LFFFILFVREGVVNPTNRVAFMWSKIFLKLIAILFLFKRQLLSNYASFKTLYGVARNFGWGRGAK